VIFTVLGGYASWTAGLLKYGTDRFSRTIDN